MPTCCFSVTLPWRSLLTFVMWLISSISLLARYQAINWSQAMRALLLLLWGTSSSWTTELHATLLQSPRKSLHSRVFSLAWEALWNIKEHEGKKKKFFFPSNSHALADSIASSVTILGDIGKSLILSWSIKDSLISDRIQKCNFTGFTVMDIRDCWLMNGQNATGNLSNIPFMWLQSFSSKPCPLPCENNGLVPLLVNIVTLKAHLAAILMGVYGEDSAWYENKYVMVNPNDW